MEIYRNRSGNSGVVAFEIGLRWITVEFVPGSGSGSGERYYRYSAASAGEAALQEMHRLARRGRGLSTFIAQTGPAYEKKWR